MKYKIVSLSNLAGSKQHAMAMFRDERPASYRSQEFKDFVAIYIWGSISKYIKTLLWSFLGTYAIEVDEDLTMEVIASVIENLDPDLIAGEPTEAQRFNTFRSYVRTVAEKRVRYYLWDQKGIKLVDIDELPEQEITKYISSSPNLPEDNNEQFDETDQTELGDRVRAILSQLGPAHRDILRLRCQHDPPMSWRDIEEFYRWEYSNACLRTRFSRAKRKFEELARKDSVIQRWLEGGNFDEEQ